MPLIYLSYSVPSSARAYLAILEGFSEDRRLDEVTSLVSCMKENEDLCMALVKCFCKLRMYPDAWALLCSIIGHVIFTKLDVLPLPASAF
jgi:hypothetical protein